MDGILRIQYADETDMDLDWPQIHVNRERYRQDRTYRENIAATAGAHTHALLNRCFGVDRE